MSFPTKTFSLRDLAQITDSEIQGDPDTLMQNVAALQDAVEGQISFVSNPKYRKLLADSKASAVILSPDLMRSYSGNALINTDPYLTFAKVLRAFHEREPLAENVHQSAVLADDVVVGKGVNIGPNVVIEPGAKIGDRVAIGAGSFYRCKI